MKKPVPIVKHILTFMHFTVLQLLISGLISGLALASNPYISLGQGVLDRKLSLQAENAELKEILCQIEKSTNIKFSFNPKTIPLEEEVSLHVQNVRLKTALNKLFGSLEISYEVSGEYIILNQLWSPTSEVLDAREELATAILISGIVTDEKGQPLPGVNVMEKGTTNGAVSDQTGKFSIRVIDDNSILTFSFIGYASQEFPVNGQHEMAISLVPDLQSLDEVVVIGYGEQKKNDVTGATSTLDKNVMNSRPITRVDQALQGAIPGVSVVSQNGQPGQNLSVRIRGTNSISGSNEPLYVIDGFIGGNLQSVVPSDIESVDVLKDASATAIYGSRGSNGVVIITTRSGKEGRTKVNFNTWVSRTSMPRYMNLMGAYDFAATKNLVNSLRGSAPTFSQAQLNEFQADGGTDWQKELTRTVYAQNYQLSISGGNPNIKYFISADYLDQPGTIINSWYKKISLRTNLDVKATKKLDFNLKTVVFNTNSRNNTYSGSSGEPFAISSTWDPTKHLKDEDGNYILTSPYGDDRVNPVVQATDIVRDYKAFNFTGIGTLNYQILEGLTFTSRISFTNEFQYNPYYGGTLSLGLSATDGASASNSRYWAFQNSNYFTYKRNFNDHAIVVTALYEQQKQENISVNATGNLLSTYSLGYYNLGLGTSQSASSGYWADELQSFLGRVNYSYKQRYLLTASVRQDGSSHLTDKYSTFPSLAAAWNVANEPFFNNVKLFSALKVRASYGKTGNQSVGPYSTISLINTGNPYFYNEGQRSISTPIGRAVTKNLKWETTEQYNIGVDAGILQNRLYLTVDLYKKNISDLLYDYPAPAYLGGGTYKKNLGTIENKGIEFTVGGTPIENNGFKWHSFLTLSFNRNRVEDLGGLDNVTASGASQGQEQVTLLKVGEPTGLFYGYQFEGTWRAGQETEAARYGSAPGAARYADINNDGVYNAQDLVVIGRGQPKYSFGFINDVSLGNFTLSLMFQGVQGNQIYSYAIAQMYGGVGDAKDATLQDVKDNMWTPEKQTDVPVVSSANNFTNSSRFVYDGSFIKMKNISLSYQFPQTILQRIRLNGLQAYISGQNLICLTSFKGYDPETTNGNNALTQGLDAGSLPNSKTYTLGLRVEF